MTDEEKWREAVSGHVGFCDECNQVKPLYPRPEMTDDTRTVWDFRCEACWKAWDDKAKGAATERATA